MIKPINPLEYVKNNPHIFFGYNENRLVELSLKISMDALSFGIHPVVIDYIDKFWVIGANSNWLEINNSLGVEQLFYRLVPNPLAGQNASRGEILLNSFAENVIFSTPTQDFKIKGNIELDVLRNIRGLMKCNFLMIFN